MTEHGRRRGIGRALRMLTGVEEALLDTVPSERARYTAMGGVVLGTALMAMFSMTVALYCVFDGFQPAILLFVPVWGAFILFLDRWLMSSIAGPRLGERFRKLLPRLMLAVVFGVIIAEPLLLGVFHTAIKERIKHDRSDAVLQRESDLRQCNPLPGATKEELQKADEAKCDKLKLSVAASFQAKEKELAELQAQATELKKDTDADDAEYARLEALARKECNGTDDPETTGDFGEGPNCRRLRGEADQFRRDQRMDANHRKLTDLNNRIVTLTEELATERADTGRLITDRIDKEKNAYRSEQKGIGLLERLAALRDLVEEKSQVRAAEWGLRLFFIAVDALPVLLKFLNGFSAYDHVVTDRLTGQRRAQRVASETERRRLVIQEELARHQMNAEHAAALDKVEFDARMRHVDVELLREQATDSRAEYLLHDAPTMPLPVPPGDPALDIDPDGGRHR
ncbi:DUF4407 domain-containing protein [Micromonospora mangrovi]|uniref:DUF4407 domain-containing protein n=2 Tax=Micromonospora TaxID=1873 RepID=A0AAU8H564_9ACTN